MPTGYTYTSYQTAVVTQIPTVTDDPNFVIQLPQSIDFAELSIYRDLDFLCMKGTLALGSITAGQTTAVVPTSVIALETAFLTAAAVNRVLSPASQDYILMVYAGAANAPPNHYAVVGNASGTPWTPALQLLIGPPADVTYTVSGYVSQRAAPLSATNTTTFISQNLPDLFWCKAMVYWSGVTKNFGAAQDDPRMAVTWEAQYQELLKSAKVEQDRLKSMSQGWQAMPPAAIAQPRT